MRKKNYLCEYFISQITNVLGRTKHNLDALLNACLRDTINGWCTCTKQGLVSAEITWCHLSSSLVYLCHDGPLCHRARSLFEAHLLRLHDLHMVALRIRRAIDDKINQPSGP